ncbi:hypothetical protein IFM89_037671 [Coptis chinensis]|uniref:Uncharacterized protein n=1 Tax=Coptis chinensis TaxID=261450 RepID=A0A835IL20_9MAGN|nr:hypothetical protein IFM89_021931 [Coptis chinensis]KAF9617608.1 hypothetical protein IFM89_037671 [Coptis chinensis]
MTVIVRVLELTTMSIRMSCRMSQIYELFPFFQNSTPSPPRPVQGSPPPPQSNSGTGHGKSINVVAIVVPTIVAVILAAICTYFITRRIRKNRKKRKP